MMECMQRVVERMYMPKEEIRLDLDRRAALPKGHPDRLRSRVVRGTWAIGDTLSARISLPHFATQVARRMDRTNMGSHPESMFASEPFGDWVPVAIEMRVDTERMMDGLEDANDRELKQIDPKLKHWDPDLENPQWKTPCAVLREVIDYVILFVDAKGGTDVRRDRHGDILPEMDVTVNNTTDPALIDAMTRQGAAVERLAESMHGGPQGEDPRDALIREMRAEMARQGEKMAELSGRVSAQADQPRRIGRPPGVKNGFGRGKDGPK